MERKTYLAIDLKSFYASVECVDRGLNPLTTHLVVADESRTEKTICLAVTPPLKEYGLSGRSRLFEVVQRVKEINAERRKRAGGRLTGESYDAKELLSPSLALSYVIAPPRMARYMEVSAKIYSIYLKYVAPEDIQVYSVDEVFIDATDYLRVYRKSAEEFAKTLISEVLRETGITATAGIAPNLYLAKVALDIEAKHVQADENGARVAVLDEMSYRKKFWSHRPLTDFWRVGKGYAKRLEENGLFTMGDIARCSLGKPTDYYNEDLLFRLFGVNAELLIDHAWGEEPCTLADIKAYRPSTNSISAGQVLASPYSFEKAKLVVWEMADSLALDLVKAGLVTDQIVLYVGYDVENVKRGYLGEVKRDRYGRETPKDGRGTYNFERQTSSATLLTEAFVSLFERIADKRLSVRRMSLTACRVVPEGEKRADAPVQLDFFTDPREQEAKRFAEEEKLAREKKRQTAILALKEKYGKNTIVKGKNLEEGATEMERNGRVGGHKA